MRTRRHHRMPDRGFTLLEVLVVVIIVGVLAALGVLAVPDNRGERLASSARQLATALEAQAQEGLLLGELRGIELAVNGYRLLRRGEDGWQALEPEQLISLPEGLVLDAELDGQPLSPAAELEPTPASDAVVPLAPDELPALTVWLRDPEMAVPARVDLAGDGTAPVTLGATP